MVQLSAFGLRYRELNSASVTILLMVMLWLLLLLKNTSPLPPDEILISLIMLFSLLPAKPKPPTYPLLVKFMFLKIRFLLSEPTEAKSYEFGEYMDIFSTVMLSCPLPSALIK